MEIFAADLDGHNLPRLDDSPGYDAEGAYTPDGKHIVFCSMRGGNPNLYVMDAEGSNVRQLTSESGYNGGPFTSPDGRWVVYHSDRKKEGFLPRAVSAKRMTETRTGCQTFERFE
jgi:TolB protein